MKQNYLKQLFTALLLLCTTFANAHDFEVGGIYYTITDATKRSVEVVDGENKYNGHIQIPDSIIYTASNSTEVRIFADWISTNKKDKSSSSKKYVFNVNSGCILKFDWQVSSESYDLLTVKLDGTKLLQEGGDKSGSYEYVFKSAGSHTLVVTYSKDESVSSRNDEGRIYNITLTGNVAESGIYHVNSIGDHAFESCYDLVSVSIPNSVTKIGSGAFRGCSGLTSIEIPCNVTSIGGGAFIGCSGLTSIIVAYDNTVYDSRNNSNAIIETSTNTLVTGCQNTVIPNSIRTIESYAFGDCTGLTSLFIPNSVVWINNYAFNGCISLKNLHIEDGEELYLGYNYANGEGVGKSLFYDSPLETLYLGRDLSFSYGSSYGYSPFYKKSNLTSVTIGDSVTYVNSHLFSGCSAIISIEIPNSITGIGDYAFNGCTSLENLYIENGKEILKLGYNAYISNALGKGLFYDCPLKNLYLGRNLSYNNTNPYGISPFYNCSKLTKIIALIQIEDLFTINTNTFQGLTHNTCILYVPYGAKETYASTAGWSEFANIVELEPEEITITINQYGSATYCSPFALDFSEVEGLKAYSAIGFKPSTQVVTLARVMTTGAGQGVFIKGEPGEYIVPVIDDFDEYTLNMLVGNLEQTVVNSTEDEMSNYKFTVAELDEAPMFYPFEDNTTFSAGKAYLQIPTAWLPATAQKSVSIRFDEGETTGIDELKGENGEVKTIYDLQGRVVESPTSGIYIIDGKKVLIK